ncbi:FecR domain-containing protein [Pontibacter sp. E15-1]|uniref:FecR family protein n=1 Tax=Pontibacter sp. E15-1 TaxID=2919918 RepID=UPI001F4F8DD7|nr:FecR domain-containing protein [Pontibacter sp. E15-1]MCJ8164252.1 FecR domain-containing protein [Pontibacter sp. E15-1]
MNYPLASATDFAADTFFITWVIAPTPESDAFWGEWLQQYPFKRETVLEARELVLLLSEDEYPLVETDTAAVWQRLQQEMHTAQHANSGTVAYRFGLQRGMLVAASVGLLLLVAGLYLFMGLRTETMKHATAFGEKRTILLPDSSVMVLNANSSVTYQAWSANEPRLVHLSGEAYFSVTHQRNHQKFVVETPDGSQVEVLGTEFNVTGRGEENRVVLASGKVRLRYDGEKHTAQQLIMQPGDLVELAGTARRTLTRKQVRPELYTAWKDNRVIFEDTPLQEIAAMLEEVYGYQVVIADASLADQRLTANLDNRGVESILETVSETLGTAITTQNNTITIRLPNK